MTHRDWTKALKYGRFYHAKATKKDMVHFRQSVLYKSSKKACHAKVLRSIPFLYVSGMLRSEDSAQHDNLRTNL